METIVQRAMLKALVGSVLLLFSGCAALRVPPRQPWPSALSPYLECRVDDPDIVIVESLRRPADAEKTRDVQVKNGTAQVSVIDGYRLMYGSKASRELVANVKVERSDPAKFAADKAYVLESVEAMAAADGGTLYAATVDGISVTGVDTKDLEKPGTLGVHAMFSDRSAVIVTIYLLNQPRERRRYTTGEQYAHARDQFLKAFSRCLRAADQSGGT